MKILQDFQDSISNIICYNTNQVMNNALSLVGDNVSLMFENIVQHDSIYTCSNIFNWRRRAGPKGLVG